MARKSESNGVKWQEKSKDYERLVLGTAVVIQNQTGKNSTKWDKTGFVIGNKPHSQVVIRVDGSRCITVRNRRFVKPIGGIPKQNSHDLNLPMYPTDPLPPNWDKITVRCLEHLLGLLFTVAVQLSSMTA